ncbi:FtsB/FtsL family cell division protein [Tepidimicrobium xylanilyticum]|uniref:Cell division protein FtsL n=1 Tax=Tepidimicrobium xylanilyticum TaxID=1123352 RepID=A0A1H2SR41_9FIRM|nr:cell division protein FtsL [Tepidimicrobium xylanilyticum]GMG96143.1 hypothetical protein EN5CB1_09690 [Tepidimicrobium xylanilyticum]SDW34096.1 cell division protein FtsL [Tepidimicrobium xylanilyticum]
MLVAKKDYAYYPEEIDFYRQPNSKRKRKAKVTKKNHARNKLVIISIAMFYLILALFILYRYANITKIRNEITELERYKIQLEQEKEILMAELEGIKSSSRIEENAIFLLGMDYPTQDQIVYVDFENEDFMDEKEDKGKLSLIGEFKNIVNLVLNIF